MVIMKIFRWLFPWFPPELMCTRWFWGSAFPPVRVGVQGFLSFLSRTLLCLFSSFLLRFPWKRGSVSFDGAFRLKSVSWLPPFWRLCFHFYFWRFFQIRLTFCWGYAQNRNKFFRIRSILLSQTSCTRTQDKSTSYSKHWSCNTLVLRIRKYWHVK